MPQHPTPHITMHPTPHTMPPLVVTIFMEQCHEVSPLSPVNLCKVVLHLVQRSVVALLPREGVHGGEEGRGGVRKRREGVGERRGEPKEGRGRRGGEGRRDGEETLTIPPGVCRYYCTSPQSVCPMATLYLSPVFREVGPDNTGGGSC